MARCSHRRRSPPSGVFRAILPLLAYAFFEVVPAALAFSCPPLVGLTRSRGDAFAGATTLRPPPSCLLGVTPLQHALRTASSPPGLQGPGSCSRRGGAAVWMSGGTEGADDPESCRLFVNGIAATVDADRLRTAFEPFPGLTGCTIAKPGLGSVTFSSAAATEIAMERMDGAKIDGTTISIKRPRGFFIRKEQQADLDLNIQKLPRVSKVDSAPTRPTGAPASFKMPPRVPTPGKQAATPLPPLQAREVALAALSEGAAATPTGKAAGGRGGTADLIWKHLTAAPATGKRAGGKPGKGGVDPELLAEATAQILLETSTMPGDAKMDQNRLIEQRVRLLQKESGQASRRPQGWINEDKFAADDATESSDMDNEYAAWGLGAKEVVSGWSAVLMDNEYDAWGRDNEYDAWGRAEELVSPEGIRARDFEDEDEEEDDFDVYGGWEREDDDGDNWEDDGSTAGKWEDDGSTADGAGLTGGRWAERAREKWNEWREEQDQNLENEFTKNDENEKEELSAEELIAAAGATPGRRAGRAAAARPDVQSRQSPPGGPTGNPLEPELASILDMDESEFDLMFGPGELASIRDMDQSEFDLMFGPGEGGEKSEAAPPGLFDDTEEENYADLLKTIMKGQARPPPKAVEDRDYSNPGP
ncbi:hypothetical protein T484DRAFT_1895274 [Baffinella frigidus]|nr:hypothetical protein T484DRAFT_1895274 [Cryptophyta sp. CCMP2293]